MTTALAGVVPRFKIGQRIRINDVAAVGHCRTPWYVRGHCGVVVEVHGSFRDPERLAYHRPGLPALVLYKIQLRQADLWPAYKGPGCDNLEVDIYEPWLGLAPALKKPSAESKKATS